MINERGYIRCINVDWLEVYALEPITMPHTADWYRNAGFAVSERDYGTRVYNEMFILLDREGHPFIEVRRNPKSDGVLQINSCHVRLTNRYCYVDNAAELMLQFLNIYSLQFVSISRLDICMDFEKFDAGDDPAKFIKRYIAHRYAKINQSEATARFDDEWERRDFNSLSWGAKGSDIRTKIYDKTMELYDESKQAFKKPYIIQAWFEARLIDNPVTVTKLGEDGKEYRPRIWRLEFSINSQKKGWLEYNPDGDKKQILSVKHNLEQYLNREMLVPVYNLLQQHYFHFKKLKHGKSKYDCKDKVLFKFTSKDTFYRIVKPASPSKPDALILRLRRYLTEYIQHKLDAKLVSAANIILEAISKEDIARFCSNQWSKAEVETLQFAIKERLEGSDEDPTKIMDFFRAVLNEII